jgi:uncharacterized protein (UPF0335 family)
MSTDRIAGKQILAFIERAERLTEERAAIAGDIKEVYAEARGNGYDVPTIKKIMKIRAQDANERMEQDALLELYMSAIGMIPDGDYEIDDEPRAPAPARAHVEIIEEIPPHDPVTGELTETDIPVSAMQDGSGPVEVHTLEQAGSTPAPATNSEPASRVDTVNAADSDESEATSALVAPQSAGAIPVATEDRSGADSPQALNADSAPVNLYADPGVVVMERCPPEGVVAHPFAACWPVNPIDVSKGVREPIVKIGKLILDGRGRYFAARDAGIEYPVVQYDGADPLLDCIRWNLASRKPSEQQRRMIAGKLAKLEPARAGDVMLAFDRHLEAAE